MFVQIAELLVDTAAAFVVFLLLARFHFQWLRVPFRNPLGEFVVDVLQSESWRADPEVEQGPVGVRHRHALRVRCLPAPDRDRHVEIGRFLCTDFGL